jgi:hypothetical protein
MRVLLLLCLVWGQAWAETLCVVPSGSDCGTSGATKTFTGLANVAWHTSDLADEVDAGDTLYICGAFTGETLSLTSAGGEGSVGNPITISFDCPGNPGSINLNGAVDYGVLLGAGTDYITIVGVAGSWTFTGASTTVSGNQSSFTSLDGSNIILTDVSASGNTATNGFRIRKCQTCTITRPVVTGSLNHGIFMLGDGGRNATDITITSPVIYSNGWQAIAVQGSSATTDFQRVTISDPNIYSNGDGPYTKFAKDVTIYGSTASGCHISYNTNTANGSAEGYGVGIQQSDNVTVYNCEIDHNRSDGIEVWGDVTVGSSNARIYRNYIHDHTGYVDDTGSNGLECRTGYSTCTFWSNILEGNTKNLRIGNSPSGASAAYNNTLLGGTYCVRAVDSSEVGTNATTGWTLTNNIFAGCTNWVYTDVTSGNGITLVKNDYYGSGSATYDNTAYTSTTVSAIDSTRLDNVDPAWTGGTSPTTAAGFRLTSGSALRRAGKDLNIGNIQDAGNRAFLHPPSIGACEATSGDAAAARTAR